MIKLARKAAALLLALSLAGCATYQGKVSDARRSLEAGNPQAAVAKLEPLAAEEGKDQLIYLLDYATALQAAGDYQAASQAFIQADKLSESKDYVSVSKQAASLLFAQEMVQYAGEDFEKLLINAMAALNFALMNDLDSARVETRRLTEKLEYFRSERKEQYKDNSLAFYLNAHIWEANRDWDSALLDYEKAYKTGLINDLIRKDLIRASQRAGRRDKLNQYTREFGMKPDTQYRNRNLGEVVVLFQQGWGPRKRPNPQAPRWPMLVPERSSTKKAIVKVNGFQQAQTEIVYDLEAAAVDTLTKQYGKLVAKRIAGIVAKKAVQKQVAKEDAGLGLLLGVAMHASDRADLRQWSTLPETVQAAHLYLPKGKHSIQLVGARADGSETSDVSPVIEVEVKARRKTFVGWRSFR